MSLTRYLYTGPQSAASLRVAGQQEVLEVQLLPGKPVELPAEHEYTKVLLVLKHLELSPEVDAAETSVTTKKGGKA